MSGPKVVGHAVTPVAPVGTEHQEKCNAVHWAYKDGRLTIAQACTALGIPWRTKDDVDMFLTFHRGWHERVIGTPPVLRGGLPHQS